MSSRARVVGVSLATLIVLAQAVPALLFLLPAALLVAVLMLGRFPGERAILAYRRGKPARRRLAPRALGSAGRPPHTSGPAGTALLAFNRAVRPPPPHVAAA